MIDDGASLGHDGGQVRLVDDALRGKLVDVLGPGRPSCKPAARVSLAMMGSPAIVEAWTASGDNVASAAFCAGVAGASTRV